MIHFLIFRIWLVSKKFEISRQFRHILVEKWPKITGFEHFYNSHIVTWLASKLIWGSIKVLRSVQAITLDILNTNFAPWWWVWNDLETFSIFFSDFRLCWNFRNHWKIVKTLHFLSFQTHYHGAKLTFKMSKEVLWTLFMVVFGPKINLEASHVRMKNCQQQQFLWLFSEPKCVEIA